MAGTDTRSTARPRRGWRGPAPRIAVTGGLWVVAAAVLITAIVLDNTELKVLGGLSGVAYAIALVVCLARTRPGEVPAAIDSAGAPRLGFAVRLVLCLCAIGLLLVLGLVVGMSVSLIGASTITAGTIVAVHRSEVTIREVTWGLIAGLIGAGAIAILGSGDLAWAAFVLVTTPVLFVAGTLLRRRARIGNVHVITGRYRRAIIGLAFGGVLAVPQALFNLLGQVQTADDWVRHWWQPLAAAGPAVVEETWAALFLVTLMYLILRVGGPRRALGVAIVLSALIHGFAHSGIDPIGIVGGSLLFTVPAGLLFARRDL